MKQAVYTKSLTISMPPEQYEQIKQITDEQQTSMAEWVREAVDAALKKLQRKEDVINDN
jgi:predicted DNA-binding protein